MTEPAASRPDEPDPEALFAAYVRGDQQAFEALFDLVGHRIFAFVRRMMGEQHRAEDVYQTVLIKAATRAKTYRRKAGVTAWLFQIARNASLDALRRESRRPVVSLDASRDGEDGDGLAAAVPADAPAPDERITREELGARIARAVESLPEEQREVFLLKEEGELTFDDIGRILGCGKETAKSRMRYALERLRNALGREARLYGLQ